MAFGPGQHHAQGARGHGVPRVELHGAFGELDGLGVALQPRQHLRGVAPGVNRGGRQLQRALVAGQRQRVLPQPMLAHAQQVPARSQLGVALHHALHQGQGLVVPAQLVERGGLVANGVGPLGRQLASAAKALQRGGGIAHLHQHMAAVEVDGGLGRIELQRALQVLQRLGVQPQGRLSGGQVDPGGHVGRGLLRQALLQLAGLVQPAQALLRQPGQLQRRGRGPGRIQPRAQGTQHRVEALVLPGRGCLRQGGVLRGIEGGWDGFHGPPFTPPIRPGPASGAAPAATAGGWGSARRL